MLFKYNCKFWIATSKYLEDLLLKERVYQALEPTFNKDVAFDVFADLYARYVKVVNDLGIIYDQTCQVQKKKLLEKLLLAASNRLLELRNQLKNIELSEFIYLDNILIKQQIITQDVQLLAPLYFLQTRPVEIQNIIDSSNEIYGNEYESILGKEKNQMSRATAINLIKIHEKARRNRVFLTNIRFHPEIFAPQPYSVMEPSKYQFTFKPDQEMLIPVSETVYINDFFVDEKEKKSVGQYGVGVSGTNKKPENDLYIGDEVEPYFVKGMLDLPTEKSSEYEDLTVQELMAEEAKQRDIEENAAKKIQTYWHLYLQKKELIRMRNYRKIFYGMVDEKRLNIDINKNWKDFREHQRRSKQMYDEQFREACENEKIRILKVRSPWIMEDISDQIRAWFKECYDFCQKFDKYPPEVKGGTILLVKCEINSVEEFCRLQGLTKEELAAEKKKEKEKKKALRKMIKDEKKKEKLLAARKKAMEAKTGKEYDFGGKECITQNFLDLEIGYAEYLREWKFIDESENPTEAPIMDWISQDKYAEVHKELRQTVDQLMKIEYELLRQALALDLGTRYVPEKEKKKKGKRAKKSKEVDLTADRSIESLYQEMLEIGLIKKYEKCYLDDYIGDYNYSAYERRHLLLQDPEPSKGEIKDIIRQFILGMGPLQLPKINSLCLAGLPKSGKKFLVRAIASECDAVIIDISPEIVYKYQDNLEYFIQLINKMGRILQPTIYFINQVHRVFWKKVPEDSIYMDPELLGTFFTKSLIKKFKPEEKLLAIGVTDEPMAAKGAKLKQSFDRFLLIPRTDYATSYQLWRTVALSMNGVPRDFEFSPIAYITKGYQTSFAYDKIEKVLNIERRMNLSRKPIKYEELLEAFFKDNPPEFPTLDALWAKYQNWYAAIDKFAKDRKNYMKKVQKMIADMTKKK